VLANALSHLCTHLQMFTCHPPFATARITLLSPGNFKFLRHIKAWILPLDSPVENHFCMIDNSISLCTRSLSIMQQTQWQMYSGGYTATDIYTVADTQRWIQCQIYGTGSRYTFSGADTQGRIHGGRYTTAKTTADIQHSKHSGRYMAADTLWQIHNGGYTEVNIQWWIYSGRYSSGYTIQQTQWLIYSSRYSGGYTTQ